MKKDESEFYEELKQTYFKKMQEEGYSEPLRVECKMPLGFPDVLVFKDQRVTLYYELKVVKNFKVLKEKQQITFKNPLRPEQIAFHNKMAGACYVLIKLIVKHKGGGHDQHAFIYSGNVNDSYFTIDSQLRDVYLIHYKLNGGKLRDVENGITPLFAMY